MSGLPTPDAASPPTGEGSGPSGTSGSGSSGGDAADCPCKECGQHHPGYTYGQEMPDDTKLRRGIRGDKLKDGAITKSAFQDGHGVSCDMAGKRSAAETMTNSAALVGTVEFTAKEAKDAFPGNKVVFRCKEGGGNIWHCQIEGKQTDGQAKAFAKAMTSRLQS